MRPPRKRYLVFYSAWEVPLKKEKMLLLSSFGAPAKAAYEAWMTALRSQYRVSVADSVTGKVIFRFRCEGYPDISYDWNDIANWKEVA